MYVGIGAELRRAAYIRQQYIRSVAALEMYSGASLETRTAASMLRNQYVIQTRNALGWPWSVMSNDMKDAATMTVKPDRKFWTTNVGVNNMMRNVGNIGTMSHGIFFGFAAYDIYSSDNPGYLTGRYTTQYIGYSVGTRIATSIILAEAGGELGTLGGPLGIVIGAGVGTLSGFLYDAVLGPDEPSTYPGCTIDYFGLRNKPCSTSTVSFTPPQKNAPSLIPCFNVPPQQAPHKPRPLSNTQNNIPMFGYESLPRDQVIRNPRSN